MPAGLSVPPTVVEAHTFSTTVALFADAAAPIPTKAPPLKLVGEALIDGQKQVKEVQGETPKLLDPGDLVTVTDESEVTLRPGEQVKLTVRIDAETVSQAESQWRCAACRTVCTRSTSG